MKPVSLPEETGEPNFYSIDPIDGRYFDSENVRYLSEKSRIAYQANIESALAQTLAEFEITSQQVADEITHAAAALDAAAVSNEEKTTKHDVKALVNTIKANISDQAKPFVHFGATSYDIVATALSLQLKQSTIELVIPRLISLEQTLIELAQDNSDTLQIGRTHGQHAVPITFGFFIAEYVERLGQNILALQELAAGLPGKFSGAVGSYNALSVFVDDPLAFESSVLSKVGLKVAPYSKQIIPAEYYIRLIDELSISAGIMANLSHDMRNLQRSEIAEVREAFEAGQTGSSTMAHKRNPWNFENVISMQKQVQGQMLNANLNIVSEHQRDLTDSASARYYVTVLALVSSMAKRLQNVMAKVEVDPENMQKNLYLSGGAIAAEPLYLLLEKHGHTEAHEASKKVAHRALESGRALIDEARDDTELAPYLEKLSDQEIQIIAEPEKYYSGLASKKAMLICDNWQQKFNA